jgi:hypothetical protein
MEKNLNEHIISKHYPQKKKIRLSNNNNIVEEKKIELVKKN